MGAPDHCCDVVVQPGQRLGFIAEDSDVGDLPVQGSGEGGEFFYASEVGRGPFRLSDRVPRGQAA